METLRIAVAWAWLVLAGAAVGAEPATHAFGVLNQRSALLTAQYWNPILAYVSARSGVALRLGMGRTAPETTAKTLRGEFDFVYTNHLFTPQRDRLGFRVIARQDNPGIQGAIVVAEDSPITSLAALSAQEVGFPSKEAFVGYWLTMDALKQARIDVKPVFGGNQEGTMAQLRVGRIAAASVNARVMEHYARREGFRYRTIWRSEVYHDLAVMAHPRVPRKVADAVAAALVGMDSDEEGRRVLRAGAELLKLDGAPGFVAANDRDYENYRRFYRGTVLPLDEE